MYKQIFNKISPESYLMVEWSSKALEDPMKVLSCVGRDICLGKIYVGNVVF